MYAAHILLGRPAKSHPRIAILHAALRRVRYKPPRLTCR
jgi:hypothetical protein